ncbi:hypothetical protein P5673_012575 [Acropora cervicornis]|uniref:Promethin n=1 Tax=Acropora cervicornis TaxID=6130 RepID=A0AAD9V7M8_ACRCE|nr:hypothetical protein P5673_012575 [Acropora cervicornis]
MVSSTSLMRNMVQECTQQRDLSLDALYKRNDTNIGLVTSRVLAFILEYPVTSLFIAVFGGLSILPLVLFVAFVMYSLVFTLLGFAMIEMTFVMSAFLLLGTLIFILFLVALVITSLLTFTLTSAAIGHSIQEKLQLIAHYFCPHFIYGTAPPKKHKGFHGLISKQ